MRRFSFLSRRGGGSKGKETDAVDVVLDVVGEKPEKEHTPKIESKKAVEIDLKTKRPRKKKSAEKLISETKKEVEENKKWYELQGASFLREDERDELLSSFQALLSSMDYGCLYVRCDEVMTEFAGHAFRTPDVRFFLQSEGHPSSALFSPTPCEDPLSSRQILREYPKHVVTESGLARTYVAYRFPAVLPEGFLYSTFGLASEICLKWFKVSPHKVVTMAESAISRKNAGGLVEKGVVENLAELVEKVRSGADVFTFYLFFVVYASGEKQLEEKSNELINRLKMYGVEVEAPPFYQQQLYEFKERLGPFSLTKTYADGVSMRCLYPLIKENLAEMGGVFIGFSGTGDPVIFDPYRRYNYLMLILGESGSGKSMTAKTYLSRLHAKTGVPIYGIDPESEYVRIAEVFGSVPVNIVEGENLGLDPIAIGMDRAIAAEILGEIYSVPQELRPRLRKELFAARSSNIIDFIEYECSEEIKKYLEPATVPPDSYIFEGTPPDVSRPVIFGMRDLRSEHLKTLASSMIAAHFSSRIMGKCVLFVDEGWLFLKTPRIVQVFENVARRGRKYGLHFLFITQRVEDVALTPEGRTLLEQAATAILLRQEREGVELLKNIYKLSGGEASVLVSALPGEGIFKVENVKMSLKVAVTQDEMEMFSTTPL